MDAKLKAKWVAALRSGEYKQGMCNLRQLDDSFCCLGVLCNLVNPNEWVVRGSAYSNLGYSGFPHALMSDGTIDRKAAFDLADMNDAGKSFAEIADYIEANL